MASHVETLSITEFNQLKMYQLALNKILEGGKWVLRDNNVQWVINENEVKRVNALLSILDKQ